MPTAIEERQVGLVTILEIKGRLTIGPLCDELDEKLQALMAAGHRALILDCSQLTGIDSVGIKSLVRGVISAQNRGGKLKFLGISGRVREVLNITRLLTVIESFDDESTALRSFSTQSAKGIP